MAERCAVCGESFAPLNPFAKHHKLQACMICSKPVGSGCFRAGKSRNGATGPICSPCWNQSGEEYVPEFGSVAEAVKGFFPVARQQIDVVKEDLKQEVEKLRLQTKGDVTELRLQVKEDVREIQGSLKEDVREIRKDLKEDIREIQEEVRRDVEREVQKVDAMVKAWLGHAQEQIDRSIQKAFGYLWVTMTSTLFLTFVGLIYFSTVKDKPDQNLNPVVVFRVSLVVLVAMPTLLWFLSAARRAVRNATLAEYLQERRGNRRLNLKDYLFGFLYFRDPVQNIWGPVFFLGVFFAAVIYLLTHLNDLF
jgi:gas vesicle protein